MNIRIEYKCHSRIR